MTDNERDQEIVRLFKEGKNRKEISEETGREYSSLCRRMRKLGLGIYANTEQKRRCTGCRKLIPDNSYKFCPYCGADIQTEEDKAIKMLSELYEYYMEHPETMSREYREMVFLYQQPREQTVCDYLSGMTDQYSMDKFREIYIPRSWEVY